MNLDERMEAGWQRKLEKARVNKTDPRDLLDELELDPRLPYRGKYEKRCQELGVEQPEFTLVYKHGVENAFNSDAVAFFPFMDIVFERVDEDLEDTERVVREQKEAEERGSDVA